MEKRIGDMYLAAALLSYNACLEEIDKSNPKRMKFCFSDPPPYVFKLEGIAVVKVNEPSLDDVETLFISKKLMFLPSYPSSIWDIKTAIHTD